MKQIAIIGGGLGGMMTAYLLERHPPLRHAITIFERSERLGGKIVTGRFSKAPVTYEAGAAELYDYSQLGPDPLRALIDTLGLSVREMAGGTVVLGDRILGSEADVGRELGPDALQALRRFMRQARSAISPSEYYESDWKRDNTDPLLKMTFRQLLDRVSDPAARRFIEVVVHSDLATEPELTHAMYGLQNALMDERDYMRLYTIEGGIERLPRELAGRVGATVMLEHAVRRVEPNPSGGYRVISSRRGEDRWNDFDYVVVALPNNGIPAIEWGGETLGDAMRRHHSHYHHPAHYLRVNVLFDRPFWRREITGSYFMTDAFGGCCVYDESSRGQHGDHGVLGWLLAGEAASTLSDLEDADLIRRVIDSLPKSLRHGRDFFLEGRVHRWVGSVNGMPGGYPLQGPEERHRPDPAAHPDFFVVGDYLFDSTLNGVLDSAEVVADLIAEEVDEIPQENPGDDALPASLAASPHDPSSRLGEPGK